MSTQSPENQASTTPAPGDVGATAAQAKTEVTETATHLVDQVRTQATTRLSEQKDRAAGGLGMVAELLRAASGTVRQQDKVLAAQGIDDLANRVEQISGTLRERDVTQLLSETQNFARQRPGLFLGGAATLGFLGTRFFRSSSSQQESSGSSTASGEAEVLALPTGDVAPSMVDAELPPLPDAAYGVADAPSYLDELDVSTGAGIPGDVTSDYGALGGLDYPTSVGEGGIDDPIADVPFDSADVGQTRGQR